MEVVQTTVFAISVSAFQRMQALVFEKDDDENGHIDMITAASVRDPTVCVHDCFVSVTISTRVITCDYLLYS